MCHLDESPAYQQDLRTKYWFAGRSSGTVMMLAGSRPYLILLLALVSAGCQSEDTSAKPPFVTVGYGLGRLTAVPLAPAAEGIAAETAAAELVAPESTPKKGRPSTLSSSAPAMP